MILLSSVNHVFCYLLFLWISGTKGSAPAVSLTVEGGVSLVGSHCPGTVRLICEGVRLVSLRWRFNGTTSTLIKGFDTNDLPANVTHSNPAVKNVELVRVRQLSNRRFANFTSILTVNLTELQEQHITEIDCGDPGTFSSEPVSLQPNVPDRPNVTAVIVAYQSINIRVTWGRLESKCPEFEGSLLYVLTLTGIDPVYLNQSSCNETVCMGTLSLSDQGQGEPYTLTLRAVDGAGSSEAYANRIERQNQQYFSPEVYLNDDCQPVAQCGQRDSDTPCTLQISTDPNQFDLNNNIMSTLNASHTLQRLAPDTTYYFQFSLQQSDTLSIIEVLSRTTPSLCYLQQQMGPDTLVSILVAVAAAFLFIVAVLITLIVLFVVAVRKRNKSKNRTIPGSEKRLE